MGYDVSYHPIKEQEIKEWYFDVLTDQAKIDKLCSVNQIDEFYTTKYKETIAAGRNVEAMESFDKTHGYYVAVVQGFFRTYFYTRGSAFSFLVQEDSTFEKYTKTWQNILTDKPINPVKNRIFENYCSGIFIPADQVVALLTDYETDEITRKKLNAVYNDRRIAIFLNALAYCKTNGLGLLEATEVVEPNPMDLNQSISYSNLINCDTDGAFLYHEAAMEQINEIEKQNNLADGEIVKNAEYVKTNVAPVEKEERKSFWKKLFG